MNDDVALLRRYVEEGSEPAFAALVRRHIDLVYSAAMRRTGGNAPLAADIAQEVFTALARQARRLAPDTVLGAWLHTATRNAAVTLMISEQRRRVRETQAMAIGNAGGSESEVEPNWEELRPLLDAAVDELPEADRTSLILRFFERRPFAEIGAALRLSKDAARMRTERALDKLRVALNRRGIRSTAAALAAVVSSQSSIAAPAGLASTLAAQSLAAGASAGVVGTGFGFMSAKMFTTAAVSAIVAFLIGSYVGQTREASGVPAGDSEVPRLAQTIGALRADNQRLQSEVTALQGEMTALKGANAELTTKHTEASRALAERSAANRKSPTIGLARYEVQQAVLNNLRQIAAARDQFQLERGAAPESVHALVGRGAFIKTLRTVGGEDYSQLALGGHGLLTVTTPEGITVTYDPAGVQTTKPEFPPEMLRAQELSRQMKPAIDKAVAAFRAANNGNYPANEQALLPFFTTPQEGADFVEMVEARKAAGL